MTIVFETSMDYLMQGCVGVEAGKVAVQRMLKKIYQELVAIRKELQAIRSILEFFQKNCWMGREPEKLSMEEFEGLMNRWKNDEKRKIAF